MQKMLFVKQSKLLIHLRRIIQITPGDTVKEKTDRQNIVPWIFIGILILILISLIGYVLVTGVPEEDKNSTYVIPHHDIILKMETYADILDSIYKENPLGLSSVKITDSLYTTEIGYFDPETCKQIETLPVETDNTTDYIQTVDYMLTDEELRRTYGNGGLAETTTIFGTWITNLTCIKDSDQFVISLQRDKLVLSGELSASTLRAINTWKKIIPERIGQEREDFYTAPVE